MGKLVRLTDEDLAKNPFVAEVLQAIRYIEKEVPAESLRVEWWGGKGWEQGVEKICSDLDSFGYVRDADEICRDLACYVRVSDASLAETVSLQLYKFMYKEVQYMDVQELRTCFIIRPALDF